MSLAAAVVGGVLVMAASGGVGWYLRRYHAAITEMLGMMVGMTFGFACGMLCADRILAARAMS